MSIHDDLQKTHFTRDVNLENHNFREKYDVNENGIYGKYEFQKFDDVETYYRGIYDFERGKRNNIEKISTDLSSLFYDVWNPRVEEPEPEPEPIVVERPVTNPTVSA